MFRDPLARELAERGFVVVRGLITAAEAAELVADYDRLVAGAVPYRTWNDEPATPEAPGMKQVPNPTALLGHWRGKRWLARATHVARRLGGRDLRHAYDQCFCKPAGCSAEIPWHQDAGYWRHGPASRRSLSCWLALSPVTLAHGGMELIPGSHRRGILPHVRAELEAQYRDNPDMAHNHLRAVGCDGAGAVAVALEPGDASFHHCRTLHRSGPNRTAEPRRGLITHFQPRDPWARIRALVRAVATAS